MIKQKGPLISDIIITPIAIVDPPLLNAAGLHAPYALRIILEIITDDQITGISEIPGNVDIEQALIEARELLVGKDVFQLNQIRQVLTASFGSESPAERGEAPWDQRKLVHIFSAVEVACMDIIGKVLGRPIVDLLGGKLRDSVPFSAYLFYKYEGAGAEYGFHVNPAAQGWEAAKQKAALTPAEIIMQAKAMCSEFGFKSIKLKGGVLNLGMKWIQFLPFTKNLGQKYPFVSTRMQFGN